MTDSTAAFCPACAGTTAHQIVFEKAGFPIRKCRVCGLGSTVIPPDFDPLAIYQRDYFQGGHEHGYADYSRSEDVLRHEFARTVRFLRKHGVQSGRLLEIGCAYGYFLLEAQPFFDSVGLEVSAHAREIATSRGLHVSGESFDEYVAGNPQSLNAAVMLDVIEHLAHPHELLKSIYERLASNGVILLTTGDWSSLLSRMMKTHWRLMTPPSHLYFFSPATLSKLLRSIGFEIVRVDKPSKIVPIGLMAYQIGKRTGMRLRALEKIQSIGMPVNLFDAFRILARKP